MFSQFSWSHAVGSSPIFLVLVAASVITLGVVLERAYYYWKRSTDPHSMLAEAMTKIRAGRVKEAVWACTSCAHPLGPVAAEVLNGGNGRLEVSEERLQVALSEQKLVLERNLGILGTMAAVAPLIGLLGTVWGIMRAFGDMARVGSAAPSVVAAGVAEALVTTAAGLVIAVPAVMCYNHFSRRMNVMLTVAENHTRSLRNALAETTCGPTQADELERRERQRIPSGLEAQSPLERETLLESESLVGASAAVESR